MNAVDQNRRWNSATTKQLAAQSCHTSQFYAECASLAYYGCYQAMWVGVGDPPSGLWRHGGLINEFCRGRWTQPVMLPTSLTTLRKKLDKLYLNQVRADYEGRSATQSASQEALDTLAEVLQMVSAQKGLAL